MRQRRWRICDLAALMTSLPLMLLFCRTAAVAAAASVAAVPVRRFRVAAEVCRGRWLSEGQGLVCARLAVLPPLPPRRQLSSLLSLSSSSASAHCSRVGVDGRVMLAAPADCFRLFRCCLPAC